MKRQIALKIRIEQLQYRINDLIARKDFEEYEELLRLSQELDGLLIEWIKIKKQSEQENQP